MKFPLLLLAILHMHGITQNNSIIESACGETPNYELCVSTIKADPRSRAAAADVEDLGLIMVDTVKAEAEAVISSIQEMMGSTPELRAALQECRRSYAAVLKADVPEAVAGLTKGIPKFAEFGMTDAAWEADICDRSFRRAVESSMPLKDANRNVRDLALIASSIIRILL